MSATLVARHNVTDYAAWRSVYDEVDSIRTSHGCTAQRVLANPDDANDVFIIHDFPTVAQAQSFVADPDFAAAMQRAGVASAPRIEIFQSV